MRREALSRGFWRERESRLSIGRLTPRSPPVFPLGFWQKTQAEGKLPLMTTATKQPRRMKIALVQMRCTGSKQANVEKALARIAEAAARGAELVCLQELFHGLYPCQSEDHARFAEAEPIPGPTSDALAQAAARHGVVVVGSLFERRAAGVYHNTAAVWDADGTLCGLYRKMHIPDDPLYYEKFYFTPGDLGFRSFATRVGRIGVCVCWDQWFPEAARLTALRARKSCSIPPPSAGCRKRRTPTAPASTPLGKP